MNKVFNPVVMAGGVGSRLWPLSRASFPKQFHSLIENDDELTLLQQTFSRLRGLGLGLGQLVCNQSHRFLAAEQCREASIQTEIILEPMGRNTGPAVVLAALKLLKSGRDEPMLVLSADHAISDTSSFRENLSSAHDLAVSGYLVTLGIQPTTACTGYGYISPGKPVDAGFEVECFIEKPDKRQAQEYFETGDFLWNSGMFIVKPSILLGEAELYCSKLVKQCRRVLSAATKDLDFIRLPEDEYSKCEDISLDYAIMEHTNKAVVFPATFDWSDVGDIEAIWQISRKDEKGNVIQGDAVALNSNDCLIRSESRLVGVLGLDGVGVIETKDAVLVASLNQTQQVKDLMSLLESRDEVTSHREVFRPWGSYDSMDRGKNYQVKLITVNPGARLSLQRHKYRAEHWVVVDGTAKVHIDGVDLNLITNDSIYIPLGAIHCLANESESPLKLVEVQSGSYLGEDDIERFDDIYGRTTNTNLLDEE